MKNKYFRCIYCGDVIQLDLFCKEEVTCKSKFCTARYKPEIFFRKDCSVFIYNTTINDT